MHCVNCHESLDAGAAFCGNCGHPVHKTRGLQVAHLGYAQQTVASYNRQSAEMKALLSVLFGVTGIVGAAFVPVIGLIFGITGVILATLALSAAKQATAIIGVVLAGLAVLSGLASWAYAVQKINEPPDKPAAQVSVQGNVTSELSTPCYSAGLVDAYTVSKESHGCDQVAYNGPNPTDSSEVYKIYANKSLGTNADNFAVVAKEALEKDVAATMPEFKVERSEPTTFAGSPAYSVLAVSGDRRTAVTETAVFHPSSTGYNVFILTHAVTERRADMQLLEAGWQWK